MQIKGNKVRGQLRKNWLNFEFGGNRIHDLRISPGIVVNSFWTDTSIRRTPGVGPCRLSVILM